MTLDQYSAHTTTGASIQAIIAEACQMWRDGLLTDEEFLAKGAEWLQQAVTALENPVQ